MPIDISGTEARSLSERGLSLYLNRKDPEDMIEAARLIRSAAELGDAKARFFLGKFLEDGEGMAKNKAEAEKWYRLAAESGHVASQYIQGMKHYGGARGNDLAIRWFRLAAGQGDHEAMRRLGDIFYDGVGVPKDLAEAAKWYRLVARLGNTEIQYRLGLTLLEGEGLAHDREEALKWLSLAAGQGHQAALGKLGTMSGPALPANGTGKRECQGAK
ncbi:MAG: sel1 repeat family protein [Deltaproteobacteria bacterium]|jgi:TPR repeat protein|nr:sel1 repeat family protein [Deltaproteobacteria bacterium]